MVTKPGKNCGCDCDCWLTKIIYFDKRDSGPILQTAKSNIYFQTLRMKQSLQGVALNIWSLIKLLCFQISPLFFGFEVCKKSAPSLIFPACTHCPPFKKQHKHDYIEFHGSGPPQAAVIGAARTGSGEDNGIGWWSGLTGHRMSQGFSV